MNVIRCLGPHDIAPKKIILLLLIVIPLASSSEVFTLDFIMVFKMIVIFKMKILIISKVENYDHFIQVGFSSHPGRRQLPSDEACGASNITRYQRH